MSDQAKAIRAAGGIVAGVGKNSGKIALVHRRRYGGEVGLPKGKLKESETEAEAALREVEEETGFRPTLRHAIGATHYSVDGAPKTVAYFMMDAPHDGPASPRDSKEVEKVAWLTPIEAMAALTHDDERELVARAFSIGEKSDMTRQFWAMLKRWFCDSPDRDRLDGAIEDVRIDLAQCDAEARKKEWWQAADQHFKQAGVYLDARNFHQGWISLRSAQRLILRNSKCPEELQLAAIELRREADKITGWREKAIEDLICNKGELRTDILDGSARLRVIRALALRDDQFHTTYFKILMRRRHLILLFLLLLAVIATTLLLSWLGVLPDPFNNFGMMAAVVLFGVLGAALSVARGLLVTDISAKIPAQKIGSFLIWMRPAIGAAAALISYVLLTARAFRIFDWDPAEPTVILTVAIVAGFSERFIVGAIERIADGTDKADADKKKDKAKNERGKDNRRKEEGE